MPKPWAIGVRIGTIIAKAAVGVRKHPRINAITMTTNKNTVLLGLKDIENCVIIKGICSAVITHPKAAVNDSSSITPPVVAQVFMKMRGKSLSFISL